MNRHQIQHIQTFLKSLVIAVLLVGLIPPFAVTHMANSLTPTVSIGPATASAAPLAVVVNGTYADSFDGTDYAGSNGTLAWGSNWIESDNGSTSSGNILIWSSSSVCGIANRCLRIQANNTSNWVERSADLGGASSASLTFYHAHATTSGSDSWAVEVSTDGSSYTSIGTVFTTDGSGKYTMAIPASHLSSTFRLRFRPLTTGGDRFYLDDLVLTVTVPGLISGAVFEDLDVDGVKDIGESGIAGIVVTAYDANGNSASSTTDGAGDYMIAAASGTPGALSGTVRVEFTLPTNGSLDDLYPSVAGSTSVQFADIDAGNGAISLGLQRPSDFDTNNASLVTAAQSNGDPLLPGGPSSRGALFRTSYFASGLNQASVMATASQAGSLWGLAYDQRSARLYAAALLKRHSGLGPGGLGAIYSQDILPSGSLTLTLFYDLASHVNVGSIPSNSARGLDPASNDISYDNDAFNLVGKVGLGDINLSTDGNTLYVVNLFDRSVYAIDVANPVAPTALPAFPEPGCVNGVARPFGLKYHQSSLYLGVVCSGENGGTRSDLSAHVYRYDGASWSASLLSFSLDFARGCTNWRSNCLWYPWRDYPGFAAGDPRGPNPILSDLEFDDDGSLILGFMDRASLQFSQYNLNPDPTETNEVYTFYRTGGDTLRAYNNSGTFVLESNGSVGPLTSSGTNTTTLPQVGAGGVNTNQGPGGGEFYWQDAANGFDVGNPNWIPLQNESAQHSETSQGALALLPNSQQVVVTFMDPVRYDSGGFAWFSNVDGSNQRQLEIYRGDNNSGWFGKSGGMGDVELLVPPAPLEIGNRVWVDSNRNGIQDGSEPALVGVTVTLHDSTGAQIASTTTNANGQYLFNRSNLSGGLAPNTDYEVRIDLSQSALNGYVLTTVNAPQPANGNAADTSNSPFTDAADSDATVAAGNAVIAYTTGADSQNNHSLDFGFSQITVSLGSFVWNDLNQDGIQDPGEPGIDGATVELLDASGNPVTDLDGNPVISQTTGISGTYYFANLAPGTYIVQVTPPATFAPSTTQSTGAIDSSTSTNVAEDDSNIDNSPSAGIYRSGVITLTSGLEPGESGVYAGDSQDAIDDASGNLTVDFGFTQPPDYTLSKTLNTPSPVRVGETVIFTIRITNTGAYTMTTVPLRDTYLHSYLVYLGATPTPNTAVAGQLDWTDLTAAAPNGFGYDLAPAQSFVITTTFAAIKDTGSLPGGVTVNSAEALYNDGKPPVTAPVAIVAPTGVTLADAGVSYGNAKVALHWSTANESDLLGFHIYRSVDGGAAVRLTAEMIPAQKTGQSDGAAYAYTDASLKMGKGYRYTVEFVGVDGPLGQMEIGQIFTGGRIFLPAVGR